MQLREHVPLAPYTTLGLGGKARYFVECDTEDQAVEWASKIPAARYGKVEVRPVVQR